MIVNNLNCSTPSPSLSNDLDCNENENVLPSNSNSSDEGEDLGLKCLYTNTDFLKNKLDLIEIYAHANNIDIIAITEINDKFATKEEVNDTNFFLPGYTSFQNNSGRGVLLLIREGIKASRINEYETFSPSIFCRISTTQNDHFVFGLIYRSPNKDTNLATTEEVANQINKVAEKLIGSNEKLIIVGDFNYPEINWKEEVCKGSENHYANKFLTCIHQNFLSQHVEEPTHHRGEQTPTLIDLVISNDQHFVTNLYQDQPFGNSHHQTINFKIDIPRKTANIVHTDKYVLNKGDYNGMRTQIKEVNWEEELKGLEDVDSCWELIVQKINAATDKFVPKKRHRNHQVRRSFIAPPSLLTTIQLKRKAYKIYKAHPTSLNYEAYATLRNQVNNEVKQTKMSREVKLAKEAKSNPKAIYQYVSARTKPRETIPELSTPDGTYTKGDQQKSEVLNTFFGSVFTQEMDDQMPECNYDVQKEIHHIEVSTNEIANILKSLKPNKSPGPDCIHPKILKEMAEELAVPFKILFDLTMKVGKIPSDWKSAEVRPIFKKGSKSSPDNYRPVSLTSVVCKVFEKIIRDALCCHMKENNILSPDQFGFCQGRSCVTQLLVTINDWMFSLDNHVPVDAAYLDFSKAFDSVPHKRLLHKLSSYGIKGNVLNWVSDFLGDRTQFVSINDKKSSPIPVTSGVPQGSVLGPTLFIYYINDLPDSTDQIVRLFADDSKVYSEIKSQEDINKLQKGIDDMVSWSEKWLMRFNSKKCKILHLGKNNPNHTYHMKEGNDINPLAATECEKDLGVNVDPLLNFDQHINQVCKKARSISGLLMRTMTCRNWDIMVPLFKALIRPHLEYANPVWSPYKAKYIKQIEQIQRDFTRHVYGMKNLEYAQRLRCLKLPSLQYRRFRGDLIEVFKLTHDLYDPQTTKSLLTSAIFPFTRCHNYKLHKLRTNTVQYKQFFTNRVVDSWNNLPHAIVNAESVNSFKNLVDKHFEHIMFETDFL